MVSRAYSEQLYHSVRKLLSIESITHIYEAIAKHAIQLSTADHGAVLSWEKETLVKKYNSSPLLEQITIQGNTLSDSRSLGLESSLIIPLMVDKEKLGVIVLFSSNKDHFTDKEKKLLTLYAETASILLKKLLLHDETKKAVIKREEFISYAAHELRNPLTSINGYIQLLYTKKKGDTSPEDRWIKQLYEDSQKFTILLKDLLNIEKVKKRK